MVFLFVHTNERRQWFDGTFWFVWAFANYCHMYVELRLPDVLLLRLVNMFSFVRYHSVLHIMFDLLCREGSVHKHNFAVFMYFFLVFMRQAQRNWRRLLQLWELCFFWNFVGKGCPGNFECLRLRLKCLSNDKVLN